MSNFPGSSKRGTHKPYEVNTMAKHVNKTYKPAELVAAIDAVRSVVPDHCDAADIVKDLHVLGFRVVYVGKIEE